MKWINSSAAVDAADPATCFNYIDESGWPFGGILVTKDKITWSTRNSRGTANSVGQAKSAVEKLARLGE